MSKNNKHKKSNWLPPKNYRKYFSPSSDYEFKTKHPVGYVFLIVLLTLALILPGFLFCLFVGIKTQTESGWILLGLAGGFVFGIGLFNFVAIIIKQYLGHLVSLVSFLIGGIIMYISWLLCR